MQVTILNRPVDLTINTVTIAKTNDPSVFLFRCIYCSWAVAQYQGKVITINPHNQPNDQVLIVNECRNRNCRGLYSFLTTNTKPKKSCRVALRYNPYSIGNNQFFCHICRHLFLEYNPDRIVDMMHFKEISLPHHLTCPMVGCGASYDVVDVV